MKIAAAAGALLVLAAAGPSPAQSPPETTGAGQGTEAVPPQLDRKACEDDKRATVGKGDTVETPQPGKDLSDKLAATDGVICSPAEVDPNIHAPAAGGGSAMPVIRPPGSPGGDPSVRPK